MLVNAHARRADGYSGAARRDPHDFEECTADLRNGVHW